jgi:hypothetical protein
MNIQINQPSTLLLHEYSNWPAKYPFITWIFKLTNQVPFFVYWFMRLSYGIVDLYKIQTYVAVKSKPVIASEYTSYM